MVGSSQSWVTMTQDLQCPQRTRNRKQGDRKTQPDTEMGGPPVEHTAGSEELQLSLSWQPSEPYGDVGTESLPAMMKQEICVGQKEDPVIGPVLRHRSQNQKPSHSERIAGGGPVCLLLKKTLFMMTQGTWDFKGHFK